MVDEDFLQTIKGSALCIYSGKAEGMLHFDSF